MSHDHDHAQTTKSDAISGNVLVGVAYGMTAVLMWAFYMAYAKYGMNRGLAAQDFVLARFGTGFVVFLPLLFWLGIGKSRDGVGFAKGLALTLGAGPLFVGLATGGYAYSSLANGAVLQPSTAALTGMIISSIILKERIGPAKMIGAAIMIFGILLLASTKSGEAISDKKWIGDLMFIIAGIGWTSYTVMIKRWNIDGITATKYISLMSGTIVIPIFLIFDSFERLANTGTGFIILMILVYGLASGILAMIAYSYAVIHLGASRAALFPAMVPAATVIVGIPTAGIWPSATEWLGAFLATLGLTIAMGALKRFHKKAQVPTS